MPKRTAAKELYNRYIHRLETQRKTYRKPTLGTAGPCVSLMTGAILDTVITRKSADSRPLQAKVIPARIGDYEHYLRSAAWQAKRQEYRASGRSTDCYVCNRPWQKKFHFHHLDYKRLGCEHLSDIVPCCTHCHKLIRTTAKLAENHRKTLRQITINLRNAARLSSGHTPPSVCSCS